MTTILLAVAGAFIDADNRVLIQKRPEGKPYAGFWEFPGGKVEQGETPEQALVREINEELGLTTVEKAFFPMTFVSHTYPEFHALVPIFGCRNWTGLPTAKEGQEIAWVKPQRLGDYTLLPSNFAIIAPLCQLI